MYQDATLWSQPRGTAVVADAHETAGLADVSRFFFHIVDSVCFFIGAVEIAFALTATLAVVSVFVGSLVWLAAVVF